MTQEQVIAAVERFYGAVTQKGHRDLRDATRGLLEALTAAAQEQVTQAALLLLQRLDDHERRLGSAERQAETADRLAEGALRRASEVAGISDARIDRLFAEQFDPEKVRASLEEIYRMGVRLSALEHRMTTLEQERGGNADR